MKNLFSIISLTIALFAMPAVAQQGPAGVPGVFGIAEMVTPTPPTPPASKRQQSKRIPINCAKAKNMGQCEARQKAQAACKGKAGAAHKQCIQQKISAIDCSKSPEPARCEQHQKTLELCKDKVDREQHRQCLRDNLTLKK